MSPSDHTLRAGRVQLLDVTAGILEELLDVALADAAPDDVTPPLGETDGWNPERIGWFREYHRAAAAGLDGPAAQKTWAISCDGQIAGSIRLRRPGAARRAVPGNRAVARPQLRGRGIGREALTLAGRGSRAGASSEAETTAENAAAQALLRSAGAELAADGVSSPVTGRISLR